MKAFNYIRCFRSLAAGLLLGFSGAALAQIQFEDVSAQTGMQGYTETWGASWGDINGDYWPDLFNQGHREYPRMFRNNGEGGFQDIAYEVDPGNWIAFPFDDKHGASFADFDNDGDEDILLSVSATGDAQFLVNTDGQGTFVDRAVDAGLDYDRAARLGVWFDYNGDGLLDVLQGHTKNIFLRYRDPDDVDHPDVDFDDDAWYAGADCTGKLNYAHLIDLTNDGQIDILCMQEGVFPLAAYDYSTYQFTNVTSLLPPLSHVNDSVVADFDNNLYNDMILTRGAIRPSGATLTGDTHIDVWLRKDDEAPIGKGITFESNGPVTFTVDHKDMGIYSNPKVFNLDPNGPTSALISLDESPGSMSIEWDAAESLWRVSIIEVERSFQAYMRIDTTVPVTNLTEVAFDTPEFAFAMSHLENGPAGFTEVTDTGLDSPVFCVSLVAGDFDNDMDKDLYVVCRRGPDNLTNRVYENQGDGSFVEVFSHGAEGPVGTDPLTLGLGESAVTADYDVDGFLDIYLTNGLLYYPVNVGGPEQLFRNLGNSNHWIELDLQGTISNRDGVGARVTVTAGGVTQLHVQNGNYHRWSQNHDRMHFGLGTNTAADITIEWPSGETDSFTAVAADALYVATENGAIAPAVMGPPVYTQLEAGDECGQPPYDFDYGPVVLLWKDCTTDVWSFRMMGGRNEEQQLFTAGQIVGDAAFSGVTPVDLIGSDTLDNSNTQIIDFNVGTWFSNDKGFDFSTTGQTTSCLVFGTQDIPNLIVGGSRKNIIGGFDLVNLGSCTPPPPLDLLECGEPVFDNATENAFFAWRDCDFQSNVAARWNFTMSGGGAPWGPYSGLVDSDYVLSATPIDIEPNDTLDTVPGDGQIDFTLRVGGNGVDTFQVDVPLESQTCLMTDTLPAGTTVLVGEDRTQYLANFELLTMETPACEQSCHP